MIAKSHLFAAAFAGVLVCSVAGAQVRGGASSVRMPSPHARPTARPSGVSRGAPQTTRSTNIIQISPSGRITSGFAPFANPDNLDGEIGVPGLGFDYPHLAAISGALHNDSSFRFGHHEHRGQGSFVPIFFGGYPYSYDELDSEQPAQQAQPQQPQIIVIQQPAPAQPVADSRNDTGNISASSTGSDPSAPVRDVGEFVLVRRDGRVLFASAFSVVGTQLQYITPEGIRHMLPMADLDTDATQLMNEARGTTLQIHN